MESVEIRNAAKSWKQLFLNWYLYSFLNQRHWRMNLINNCNRNTIDIRIKDCKFFKVEIPKWKFWKGTNSHYIIIIDCEIRKIYINKRWKGPSPNHLTSQESPSLKRKFFKRFNKNLIMLISILVLIETSLKGNGCNLTNSDRNHRNVSGILHSNSASKTDIWYTNQSKNLH